MGQIMKQKMLVRSVALIVLLLAPTLIGLSRGAGRYVRAVVNVEDRDVRMAKWLARRLPKCRISLG